MTAEGHLPVQEISVHSFRETRSLALVFPKSCNPLLTYSMEQSPS